MVKKWCVPCHLPLSSSHLFAEESIATSHNQERAFSPLVRERYEKLCSMCERIVAALNDFLGAVTCDLPIINVDNRTAIQNIENCVFKFGMSAKRGEQMPVEFNNDFRFLVGQEVPYCFSENPNSCHLALQKVPPIDAEHVFTLAGANPLRQQLISVSCLLTRHLYDLGQ